MFRNELVRNRFKGKLGLYQSLLNSRITKIEIKGGRCSVSAQLRRSAALQKLELKTGDSSIFLLSIMNCKDVTRLVSQSMDEKIPWHLHLKIRFHLIYCTWCKRYQKQLEILRQTLRAMPEKASFKDARMPESAKDRIRKNLQSPLE
jgi:hypothetical protein